MHGFDCYFLSLIPRSLIDMHNRCDRSSCWFWDSSPSLHKSSFLHFFLSVYLVINHRLSLFQYCWPPCRPPLCRCCSLEGCTASVPSRLPLPPARPEGVWDKRPKHSLRQRRVWRVKKASTAFKGFDWIYWISPGFPRGECNVFLSLRTWAWQLSASFLFWTKQSTRVFSLLYVNQFTAHDQRISTKGRCMAWWHGPLTCR